MLLFYILLKTDTELSGICLKGKGAVNGKGKFQLVMPVQIFQSAPGWENAGFIDRIDLNSRKRSRILWELRLR